MLIRRIDSSKEQPQIGDTTKRIVVFLFGMLFAMVATVAVFAAAYVLSVLLGVTAIILFAIALWGKRKPVVAAHDCLGCE